MKEYETFSTLKIPKSSPIILRLDGRSFHTLTNKINLDKPYDDRFKELMGKVSFDLFKEFHPSFIYSFSDEINILLNKIPFNYRLEKIDSVIASFTSSSFTLHFNDYFQDNLYKPVSFDSRVILTSKSDVSKYFKWRQDEAWKNCINSHGIHFLKSKYSSKKANEKIMGLKTKDIHEMLFKNGINLNDVETWKKRGIATYSKNKIISDFNIPIFSDNFFKKFL